MAKLHAFNHLGPDLAVSYIGLNELNPYKNNARTHSKAQIRQIAQSIKEFGFTNPILIDGHKNVIAGQTRQGRG